jgi:hypothetical protein
MLSGGVKPWGGSVSDVFVPLSSVVFSRGIFMVKLEKEVDAKVPTKVMKTDIDTMNTLMASSIAIEESDQRTSLRKLCCGMLLSFIL